MAQNWVMAPAPVARRVRAYFAPVARATQTPVLFDAALEGDFDLNTPSSPWIDLGWIDGFTRKPASKTAAVLTGIPAAPLEQVRESVQAEVSFEFLNWTKLTMALATGSQHMNLLAPAVSEPTSSPDGATAASAASVLSGSTSTTIILSSTDAAKFSSGNIVVVDVDYGGQTGYVGTPVSGAYIKSALNDVDYVRRVSFNAGFVTAVGTGSFTLAVALPGGAPTTGMKVQRVLGFVDREGGTFYQEWSALFVMEGSQGERILFHYPRLQTMVSAEEQAAPLDAKQKTSLARILLKAHFMALPVTDALDGERVVCYRSFLPAAHALV